MTDDARGFPAFPARPGRRGRSWWAREFTAAMEDAALDVVTLRRGRRFAGSGRLGPITVSPGRIAAVADDPDDGPLQAVVHLPALSVAGWERLLDQVAAEAGHLAALLDGEVPRTLVRSADAAGVALLPGVGELESECECPEVGDPCTHAAALCYQVAWLLDDDPFLLLLVRGRGRGALLGALAERDRPPAPGGPSGADPSGADPSGAAPSGAAPSGSAAAGPEGSGAERAGGGRSAAEEPAPGAGPAPWPEDRPVPATDTYAAATLPLPGPAAVHARTPVAVPPPPGLPVDLLAGLAAAAATRARALRPR